MIPRTASDRPANEAATGLGYAWWVVIALTGVYTLSFVDRTILSLLVPSIKRDLGVSDTQIGLLQGLAFSLFYTLMGLPIGRIADRSNRRNLIVAGILVWSFFTTMSSVAKSFVLLFLTRIGVGVGEASLSPAGYSMLSDYFPKQKLGAAISVFYMGVFIGSALAQLVGGTTIDMLARTPFVTVPILGTMASWRLTFVIVGLPGVLFAALAWTIREPVRRNLLASADGRPRQLSFGEAVAQIRMRWQSVAGISLAMVCQGMITYGLLAWIPTFFQRVHHWSPGQSGRALAAILLTFGCAGMYFGGRLSDHWQKRGVPEGPLKVAVISAIGTLLLMPVATLVSNPAWTLALLAPALFFDALAMGTSTAALQHIFPNQVRGQVSALYLFLLNLGGGSLGPLLPGVFNDYLFHNPNMVGYSLAITVAIGAIGMLVAITSTFGAYRIHYDMMKTA
ncbi:MAG TPA: MFS transporter [Bryobacteraceae bacterium]|jgi:MFS family permease|nr:MFS transporter [Bryobacteraceae bacterium]